MAEIVVGLVGPAIQVVKRVGAPILRQFNYLCCFTANITNLKNEAKKLQDTEQDLQGKVDAARNDEPFISGEVEVWLRISNEIKDEMDGIINEVPNVEGGCLKLRARFSLSRRAKKTTDRLKEIQDQYCKFKDHAICHPRPALCHPRPPAATKAVPSERTYNLDSRKKIEEDIMAILRSGDVKMMGICGMGGLGKTTTAKRIMNRALEEHVFEEVVMTVVSLPIDKLKIQLEIGGSLGLKLEGESLHARVQTLHERLSGTKRTLVILDDVWERFRLEDLGIPRGYEGCTILLTSRNRDVLNAMNVEMIFGMEVLSEEDSWLLFRMVAGHCVDDIKLNSIAKEVVSECAGLPYVLITVGAALNGAHVSIWENALQRLKINCTPDIPGYIAKVYNPLKLSYDVLERKYQDVFLLCCLYPEDAHIPLERLTYFCMGLRLFEGAIGNVEAARNRIRALSKVLKSRSLLLDSERGDDYVRMHNVVRDVCIYIAKQEGYIGDNDLTSSLQRYKLHSGFELLQIRNSDEEINFDGITDLYVLSIERCSQLTSLPFTQRPNNLITLVLDSCKRLETLSAVVELVNLEILVCRDCDLIEQLPPEIKGLKRLKVLDLTECRNLKRIGRGIISSLVGLEELKMLESFDKWEGDDREERENAGLRELEALTNLRCLEIMLHDPALAAENIRLSSAVDRFAITNLCESRWLSNFDEYLFNKKMCLNWEGATHLGHWVKMQLLRDTECLFLVGNGANEVGLINLEKIRCLELGECESIILSNSFQNLKLLKLDDLPVLKQLWKSSKNDLGKDFLPQLEVLEIRNCEMMEVVFLWKGEDRNENNSCHHIIKIFPKLKELELVGLPNLISFCQGIKGIEFPLLRRMEINECGKMKGMVSNEGGLPNLEKIRCLELGECESMKKVVTSSMDERGATVFPSIENLLLFKLPKLEEICDDRILLNSFQNLKTLKLDDLPILKQLWKSSQNDLGKDLLPQLEVLEIRNCEMMEVVFLWKGEDRNENNSCHLITKIFPKLKELELVGLPNLISFCQGIQGIEFPLLRRMEINECSKMKGMVSNEVGLTNLKKIRCLELGECEGMKKVETSSMDDGCAIVFPSIEHLMLFKLPKLEEICDDRILLNSFQNLKTLKLDDLPILKQLWKSSQNDLGKDLLPQLEVLEIRNCEMMEVVFLWKGEDLNENNSCHLITKIFPKLKELELVGLPNLISFCQGIKGIEFPLRRMEINKCSKMKGMVSNENNSGGSSSNASIHDLFRPQEVSFDRLKKVDTDWNPFSEIEELTISECAGSLTSSSKN